eukprot:2242209-Amphidinium_carterae.1
MAQDLGLALTLPLGLDVPDGPAGYEESLNTVDYMASRLASLPHCQAAFANLVSSAGVVVTSDFSGTGTSELALRFVEDQSCCALL